MLYHDLLIAARKIKLVDIEEKPSMQNMINQLKNAKGNTQTISDAYKMDAEIFELFLEIIKNDRELGTNYSKNLSLEDFLVMRCKRSPSQSLEEIIFLLETNQPNKIDQEHLLVNLLHFHFKKSNNLSCYDISTLVEHYLVLKMFKNDPALQTFKLEFVPSGEKSNDKISENSKFNILGQRIKITQKNSTQLFYVMNEIDGFSSFYFKDSFEKDVNGNSVYYTKTTAILAQEIQNSALKSYVLPTPVLGLYDFSIFYEIACNNSEGANYRPVSIPTLLSPLVCNFFYGIKIVNSDIKYGSYIPDGKNNVSSNRFRDARKVHNTQTSYIGIIGHDHIHVRADNSYYQDEIMLKIHLSNALEKNKEWSLAYLQESAKYVPDSLIKLKFRQNVLDVGIIGALQISRDAITSPELKNRILNEIFSSLSSPIDKNSLINSLERLNITFTKNQSQNKIKNLFGYEDYLRSLCINSYHFESKINAVSKTSFNNRTTLVHKLKPLFQINNPISSENSKDTSQNVGIPSNPAVLFQRLRRYKL